MHERPPLSQLQAKLCKLAEKIALEAFNVRLDYSPGSIRVVEQMLGRLHEEYRRNRSDDGLHGVALEFSAYIVTVIQRHYGPAHWERDCLHFGEDAFPLQWQGSTLYPYAWCLKRLLDGPADDVWSKFQVCILAKEPPRRPWWKLW